MPSLTVGPTRNPVMRAAPPTSTRQLSRRPATHARRAVHEERTRLARELHDSVAQTLYVITLNASRVLMLLQRSETEQVHTIVNDMLRLADTGQTELRALLHELRSDEVDQFQGGLIGALASEAAVLEA
jgi:signal transduction histidine kinase